ncbi:MAG: hypothetical protein J6K31_05490 [Parabacteroides sp.]|nr:hypothetical protein [Parabacteroides sp.]
MDNNLNWTNEDWLEMVNTDKATVYLQKKIIVRILRDTLVWSNSSVNSKDEQILYWLTFRILNLNQEDIESILSLNPLIFPTTIGKMDKIRQCSFRRIFKEMFTHDGRKPSTKEIIGVERLLNSYPNPYRLENEFEKIPPLYPDYKWQVNSEYEKTHPFYVTCWL